MGTRATILGLTPTTAHRQAAQANGRNANALFQVLADQIFQATTIASEMLKDMEVGANKTAVQGIVTALS